ncbi:MAG: discoidin domain-containing protein [Syntrophobacteraceae bacterium]|nr:discoidin domain-containing protein [Desulfobacteraceae bacterium]
MKKTIDFKIGTAMVCAIALVFLGSIFFFGPAYCQSNIERTGWTLQYVDSQELVAENGAALNSFDGKSTTIWHTQYYPTNSRLPHEIQINLGALYEISGFRYLPRQDGSVNGRIKDYQFYVGEDGVNWGSPVATGSFANSAAEKTATFSPVTGRYIRLVALSEVNGSPWTSMAEINVVGVPSTVNLPPNGAIASPAADVTITAGETVVFAGTATDPNGDTSLTYRWHFGDPAIADSTLKSPGAVKFNNLGTYTVTFIVTDSQGLTDPSPDVRTVTVQAPVPAVIAHTNWTLQYVDSQEVLAEKGSAVNSFDGKTSTIWHTQYSPSSTPLPHEIQINLGTRYEISGFRYLPRQDGGVNGRIKDYRFYVSEDGVNWGNPVATGSFANTAAEKQVTTSTAIGQFVRLVALSEVNGGPWTSMAEINVVGMLSLVNLPPDGTITSPASNATIAAGQSVTFAGTATDPNGDTSFTCNWHFGDPAIADSSSLSPGPVQFNNPGTYTVTFTVTDSEGLADPTPASRTITVVNGPYVPPEGTITKPSTNVTVTAGETVSFAGTGTDPDGNTPLTYNWHFGDPAIADSNSQNPGPVRFYNPGTYVVVFTVADAMGFTDPTPDTRTITVLAATPATISHTGWSLSYVDSQELVAEKGAAVNSFDGKNTTIWHTQYYKTSPPPPHEIQINLGARYEISGFRYLPRQDGGVNGRIKDYRFYVGTNGTDWGTPVATGSFANSATEKTVAFSPVVGQYVRLVALNEVNGNPWTSMAEINVLSLPECLLGAPSVTISEPRDSALQWGPDLYVHAYACLDSAKHAGWGVRFKLNGGAGTGGVTYDAYWAPYEVTFKGVLHAEHTIDAVLIDAAGNEMAGANTSNRVSHVKIGDYYVAVGDSITKGSHDDITSDNTSLDGRNTSPGFEPILNNLLTQARGWPHTVINKGISGDASIDGLSKIAATMAEQVSSCYYLILYGTNDAWTPVPSGLGLRTGDSGYPGSYKDNMRQIMRKIKGAGKIPYVAKIPIASGQYAYLNTTLQEYNEVIDELAIEESVPVVPPDFYCFFSKNPTQIADGLHPNGTGYQSMAAIWRDTLLGKYSGCLP